MALTRRTELSIIEQNFIENYKKTLRLKDLNEIANRLYGLPPLRRLADARRQVTLHLSKIRKQKLLFAHLSRMRRVDLLLWLRQHYPNVKLTRNTKEQIIQAILKLPRHPVLFEEIRRLRQQQEREEEELRRQQREEEEEELRRQQQQGGDDLRQQQNEEEEERRRRSEEKLKI